MEFKPFPKIGKLGKLNFNITQKIHGTNAQICIYRNENGELSIKCGSRNRWITPDDDNFGFASFVYKNKDSFIECLGFGTHFGEWAGPGINSGEGLSEKTFILFDFWRYPSDVKLPPQTRVVPVIYQGPMDLKEIDKAMDDLKQNGSKLVPGFMRPEGVVISLNGERYKKVFDAEETQWKKTSGVKNPKEQIDYSYLLQPIRLEKLLSRDERYLAEFPKSLPVIVKDYLEDLVSEDQIKGDVDEIKAIRKGATKQIFSFIKTQIEDSHE